MDKPRSGTCPDCRWSYYLSDEDRDAVKGTVLDAEGFCRRAPYNPPAGINQVSLCGEFEPPEGRVCGTCECYASGPYCELVAVHHDHNGEADRDPRDTCNAWRWKG